MNGSFLIKDDQLLYYFHKAKGLDEQFNAIEVKHVPREENARADTLSKLANRKENDHLSSMVRQVLMRLSIEFLNVSKALDCLD